MIRTENRLVSWGPSLINALATLFREIARAINDISTRGIDTQGTLIIDTATTGVVFKDTQATPHYWRLTVDNTGALVTTDEGTTKPDA